MQQNQRAKLARDRPSAGWQKLLISIRDKKTRKANPVVLSFHSVVIPLIKKGAPK